MRSIFKIKPKKAGQLQYRLGRRKWQEVWCVVVENLLYIYESIGAQITWDVIDLSCFKPITDLQQNKSRFKLKIVNRSHESHEFYTENAAQFYLWFATFDRIHNRGVQKRNGSFIDFLFFTFYGRLSNDPYQRWLWDEIFSGFEFPNPRVFGFFFLRINIKGQIPKNL